MTSMSVVVPTYRRPADLRRCLDALAAQSRLPDEVVVVCRPEDEVSRKVVGDRIGPEIRLVLVTKSGAVAAYNAGIDAAAGGIVSIIDDDTRPKREWLEKVERHFEVDPRLGALGGRDVVHIGENVVPASEPRVGIIEFHGRMTGNHHVGVGPPREVHVVKGANMSFRREALEGTRFDMRLLGSGAQVHLEVGVCTQLRRKGWRLIYDPAVVVDHFPAIRHDEDGRSGFSSVAQHNAAHNETLAVLDFLPLWRRAVFLMWAPAIGTRAAPGLLQALRLLFAGERHVLARLGATLAGRIHGVRTWLREERK